MLKVFRLLPGQLLTPHTLSGPADPPSGSGDHVSVRTPVLIPLWGSRQHDPSAHWITPLAHFKSNLKSMSKTVLNADFPWALLNSTNPAIQARNLGLLSLPTLPQPTNHRVLLIVTSKLLLNPSTSLHPPVPKASSVAPLPPIPLPPQSQCDLSNMQTSLHDTPQWNANHLRMESGLCLRASWPISPVSALARSLPRPHPPYSKPVALRSGCTLGSLRHSVKTPVPRPHLRTVKYQSN